MGKWKSEALIVDAVRSPIGRRNGTLSGIRGDELAGQVLNGLVERDGRLLYGAAGGALELLEVHPAGKRTMSAADWLRGNAARLG